MTEQCRGLKIDDLFSRNDRLYMIHMQNRKLCSSAMHGNCFGASVDTWHTRGRFASSEVHWPSSFLSRPSAGCSNPSWLLTPYPLPLTSHSSPLTLHPLPFNPLASHRSHALAPTKRDFHVSYVHTYVAIGLPLLSSLAIGAIWRMRMSAIQRSNVRLCSSIINFV